MSVTKPWRSRRRIGRRGTTGLLALVLGVTLAMQGGRGAVALPETAAAWLEQPRELRWWIWHRATRDGGKDVHQQWLGRLASLADHDLLADIAVHVPQRGTLSDSALRRLYDARDPRWVPLAVHLLGKTPDSHAKDQAQALLESRPQWALAWLGAHRTSLAPQARALGRAQAGAGVRAGRDAVLAPPIDPVPLVLPFLDSPPHVAELHDAADFDPRQRYVFEVERALDAMVTADLFDEPYLGKLVGLLDHAVPRIRRRAFQVLCHAPAARVPLSRLQAIAADDERDAADRSLAVLAAGRIPRPEVHWWLLDVATAAGHPGTEVARGRLVDRADPYVVLRLDGDPALAARLAARRDAWRRSAGKNATELGRMLARAVANVAWARLVGDRRAAAAHRALVGELTSDWAAPSVRRVIGARLRLLLDGDGGTGTTPAGRPDGLGAVRRDTVAELLDAVGG